MPDNNAENTEYLDLTEQDLTDLTTARHFRDDMYMIHWYVDCQEETVVMYTEDEGVSEENDRLGDAIHENPDRFVKIEPTHSSDDWQVMSNFISEEVDEPLVRDRLREAIDGSGAFRRFKEVVAEEGLKDRWHAYRERKNREEAISWLEAHDLISDEKAEEFRASLEEIGKESGDETDPEEQMTEGGVVECTRDHGHKGLSKGTRYEIVDERPGDKLIQIRDDRDNLKWYNKPNFDLVEPGRKRDIDDLLMNIEVDKKDEHYAHARILFDQGGYWTVRVATPEWLEQQFDAEPKGAHLGIRKLVIVPSLEEREVNRALTALNEKQDIAPYALKRD
jgi:hypothetical protein